MAAGSIVIDLLMRTGAFETDTKRAAQIAERRAKEIEKTFAAAGTAIAAGMTAAFGAVTASIASSVRQAGEISKLAQIANATTSEFQTWAAASKTVGIEQDKLGDILKDVNDRVGDFLQTGGGPMKDFFEQIAPRIGLTAEAFRNLSGPQALQLYVDSLQKAGVSQQEMTFYLEAMASDTTALVPLLANGGAEMRRLGDEAARTGQVMSSETIAGAKMLSEQMDTLAGQWNGAQNILAGALIPSLVSLGNQMTTVSGQTSAAKEIADGIAATFEWIVVAAAGAKTAIAGVGTAIGATAAAATEVGGGAKRGVVALFETWAKDGTVAGLKAGWAEVSKGIEGAGRVGDLMREDAERGTNAYVEFRNAILGARQAAAGAMVGPPDLRASAGPGIGALPSSKPAKSPRTAGPSAIEREAAQIFEQTRTASERLAAEYARLNKLREAGAITQDTYNRAVFQAQAEFDKLTEAMNPAVAAAEQLNALLSATPTAQLEETRKDMKLLAEAFEQGRISAAQFVEATQTRLGTLPDAVSETKDQMTIFAEEAGRNMQTAFADFLFDPFQDGLNGMLKGLADTLRKMMTQAAASRFLQALGNYGTSSGGWFGNLLGSIFGGQRASGGPVAGGRMYEVNERGTPELLESAGKQYLMMGPDSGRVTPITASLPSAGAGTGGVVINITNNSGGEVKRNERQQGDMRIIDIVIEQAVSAVAGDIAQGGRVASAMQGVYGLNRGAATARRG